MHPAWSYPVIVAAAALLLYAAWVDAREFRISNKVVLALAGLFACYALLAVPWSALRWDLAFAALMFLILLVLYALGGMGGGDVKMLAVAFLWVGLAGALPFAIALGALSASHALLAKLGWARSQITKTGRRRIPFAPAIAGAVICVFVLRALQAT